MLLPKVCPYCGQSFEPKNPKQITCSRPECQKARHKENQKAWWKKKVKINQNIKGICPYCGKVFLPHPQGKIKYTCGDKACVYSYQKEWRRKKSEEGICIRCFQREAVPGKRYCSVCAKVETERGKALFHDPSGIRRSQLYEWQKKKYWERASEGVCVKCASPRLASLRLCLTCLGRMNRYWKRMSRLKQRYPKNKVF
ncbi:hypothetical protein F9B85_10670 [Heliorestis acidaminivorans]|uniref:Uncharacterized protein n=1 Tax=Heliorestis acidaminivorans TaxID=553427 RepID=A0A6I0ESW3_9FIRM|nr:hypothetical protein [Heliorestis acidaminivorans]KAB2952011.1 hypothetical protein F9B85_10670 [Heliorestis acidaminivorans]